MQIFFTADTHYTHQRTLELSRRPFLTVQDMDEAMITRTNAMCGRQDLLYHVGDYGDYSTVRQINVPTILICGNYEYDDINKQFGGDFQQFRKNLLALGFKDVVLNNLIVGDMYLNHFPNNRLENRFNLFGHIHRLQMVKRNGLNVGVDCHDYCPISMETVNFYRNFIENICDDEVFNV